MSKKSKPSIEEVDAESEFFKKYDKPYPSPNYKLLFGVLIVILLAFGCVFGVAIISIMGIPIDEFSPTGDDLKPVDTPYIPENMGLPIVNESNVSEGNSDNVSEIYLVENISSVNITSNILEN